MPSRARAVRSYPCKGRLLASKSALMPLEKRPKIDPKWPRPARSSAPWLVVACTLAGNRLATRSGHVGSMYAQFSAPRAILGARGGLRDRWSGPGAHLRGSAALRRHGLHYQRLRQRQRHRVQRWQRPWQSAEGPDLRPSSDSTDPLPRPRSNDDNHDHRPDTTMLCPRCPCRGPWKGQ